MRNNSLYNNNTMLDSSSYFDPNNNNNNNNNEVLLYNKEMEEQLEEELLMEDVEFVYLLNSKLLDYNPNDWTPTMTLINNNNKQEQSNDDSVFKQFIVDTFLLSSSSLTENTTTTKQQLILSPIQRTFNRQDYEMNLYSNKSTTNQRFDYQQRSIRNRHLSMILRRMTSLNNIIEWKDGMPTAYPVARNEYRSLVLPRRERLLSHNNNQDYLWTFLYPDYDDSTTTNTHDATSSIAILLDDVVDDPMDNDGYVLAPPSQPINQEEKVSSFISPTITKPSKNNNIVNSNCKKNIKAVTWAKNVKTNTGIVGKTNTYTKTKCSIVKRKPIIAARKALNRKPSSSALKSAEQQQRTSSSTTVQSKKNATPSALNSLQQLTSSPIVKRRKGSNTTIRIAFGDVTNNNNNKLSNTSKNTQRQSTLIHSSLSSVKIMNKKKYSTVKTTSSIHVKDCHRRNINGTQQTSSHFDCNEYFHPYYYHNASSTTAVEDTTTTTTKPYNLPFYSHHPNNNNKSCYW